MAYRLLEDEAEIREILFQASAWAEISLPDGLTVRCMAFDKDRPALALAIGHGGFSDPGTKYVLHIPSSKVEFSVYTNSFSTQYCDIEWYLSSPKHRSLESEINQAIYDAWACFNSKWGKRHEKPSMTISHQGECVKIIAS